MTSPIREQVQNGSNRSLYPEATCVPIVAIDVHAVPLDTADVLAVAYTPTTRTTTPQGIPQSPAPSAPPPAEDNFSPSPVNSQRKRYEDERGTSFGNGGGKKQVRRSYPTLSALGSRQQRNNAETNPISRKTTSAAARQPSILPYAATTNTTTTNTDNKSCPPSAKFVCAASVVGLLLVACLVLLRTTGTNPPSNASASAPTLSPALSVSSVTRQPAAPAPTSQPDDFPDFFSVDCSSVSVRNKPSQWTGGGNEMYTFVTVEECLCTCGIHSVQTFWGGVCVCS